MRDRFRQIRTLVEGDEKYRAHYLRTVQALYRVLVRQITAVAEALDVPHLLLRDSKSEVDGKAYLKLLTAFLHETLYRHEAKDFPLKKGRRRNRFPFSGRDQRKSFSRGSLHGFAPRIPLRLNPVSVAFTNMEHIFSPRPHEGLVRHLRVEVTDHAVLHVRLAGDE